MKGWTFLVVSKMKAGEAVAVGEGVKLASYGVVLARVVVEAVAVVEKLLGLSGSSRSCLSVSCGRKAG